MEKIGIICEYNPFHNGHLHHLKAIKKMYPDSIIILALNGNFMQRGEISILSKDDKVSLALLYGIDIVIEIPILFGTQSADTFAFTAIKLLNELKVEKIIFGSESNDLTTLNLIAEKSLNNKHNKEIKQYLDKGLNYPTALAKSLKVDFNFLSNDLLGISYLKAIKQINKNIEPLTIQRTNNYLDLASNDSIISASNIREKLKKNKEIKKYVPKETKNRIINIDYELYFKLIKSIILQNRNLKQILDVDEGLEYRLYKGAFQCNKYNDFLAFLKTKRYTYNRINRMLVHLLLGITKEDAKLNLDYIRILGFNKKGQNYLSKIKKQINLPLQNKNSKVYQYELKAAAIYDLITNKKTYEKELSNKPIIF